MRPLLEVFDWFGFDTLFCIGIAEHIQNLANLTNKIIPEYE